MIRKVFVVFFILLLSGCIEAGKFTPERHAEYELGHPDCQKTPERCIDGVAW